MTDRPDIAAIEARANAATPGPWVWRENGGRDMGRFDSEAQGYPVCTFGDASDYYPTQGEPPEAWDREFIAHARTDILALVAEVRRLEAENDALSVENDRLQEDVIDWPKWARDCVKVLEQYGARPDIDGVNLPEDIAEWLAGFTEEKAVAAAVAKERDAERERCAGLVDARVIQFQDMMAEAQRRGRSGLIEVYSARQREAEDAAAAIRAAR